MKISSDHMEHQNVNDLEKKVDATDGQQVDHFGTGTTYSPEEKALVRRLDWHIMPILFAMYYMSRSPTVWWLVAATDRGRQDGPKRDCERPIGFTRKGSRSHRQSIQCCRLRPLCWLHLDPNPKQPPHVEQTGPSVALDGWLDARMGRGVCLYWCRHQLYQSRHCPYVPWLSTIRPPPLTRPHRRSSWLDGSSILPRCHLPTFPFLHEEGNRHQDLYSLLGKHFCDILCRFDRRRHVQHPGWGTRH